MKLKIEILERMYGYNSKRDNILQKDIREELNISQPTYSRYTSENRENGPLTTIAVLSIISTHLGEKVDYLIE